MVVPFETKEDLYPGDRNQHFPILTMAHSTRWHGA
jgi:hypothetical protein